MDGRARDGPEGEWTRRVAIDVFAFAMSDYVFGVFLMLALLFLLILL